MPGTNASVTFDYYGFGKFDFSVMPKGCFFNLSVNPYNGLVVLCYNRNPEALEVVDDLLNQIRETEVELGRYLDHRATFSDFVDYENGSLVVDRFEPCPFCGHEPEFVVTRDLVGETFGDLVCCGGRTRIEGFRSKFDAVSFWNNRSRKVA